MSKPLSVLVIDDDNLGRIVSLLEDDGHFVFPFEEHPSAIRAIDSGDIHSIDLAIVDLASFETGRLDRGSADETITSLKKHYPTAKVYSCSGYNHRPNGASRHVLKPYLDKIVEYIALDFP